MTRPPFQPNTHKQPLFAQHLLQAALVFCLGLQFIFSVWLSSSILLFPFGADYGEAPLVDQAQRLANGSALYKMPLDTPPYIISNYPPLYPLLVAGFTRLVGTPALQTGRILSWMASLVCAGMLGWIVGRLSGQRFAALVTAGLFLANPAVVLWGAVARVDMMALMFSLLALGICLRWKPSWFQTWLISLCLVAAVCTRQTYLLAAPLAACVALWPHSKQHALGLGGLFAAQILGGFALLNGITQGGFYAHIVQANVNAYEISRTMVMLRQFVLVWPVATVLAVWLSLKAITRKPGLEAEGASRESFLRYGLPVYSLLALASSLTVGKVGSNINYFLELVAALALWAGLGVGSLLRTGRWQKSILTLLSIQSLWVLVVNWGLYQPAVHSLWASLDQSNQLYQRVQAVASQGPVLADNHLSLALKAGQSIYYQPFEYGQLYQAGLWDPEPLAEEIRQQKFPLILIGGNALEKPCCWPPETTAAIRERYDIVQETGVLVCTPKRK